MKRMLTLLLALLMILSCANFSLAETINEIPPAKEGETVVEFWMINWGGTDVAWTTGLIDKWNSNPDRPFYVNFTTVPNDAWDERIKAARASESAPDILVAHYAEVANYYHDGYTLDMTNLISPECWDDLYDQPRSFVTVEGALAAYPWRLEPSVVMYYDKASKGTEAYARLGAEILGEKYEEKPKKTVKAVPKKKKKKKTERK